MKLFPLVALTAVVATPAFAQEARQLNAHEHGVGQLDIAFDGDQIAMELHAPGADIVGFEYGAKSTEDRAAVDAAVAALTKPLDLFVLAKAAGCIIVNAIAGLESEEDHDPHDEGHDDDHAAEEDGHDDHADEGHEDHADEADHTEFHAEYLLTCADPSVMTDITFAYFDAFPNALEVEVQVISDTGATSFEVERDAPTLDLRGMF